jgi:PAS domain S-box-containing protein
MFSTGGLTSAIRNIRAAQELDDDLSVRSEGEARVTTPFGAVAHGAFGHAVADAETLRLLIDSTTDYAIVLLDPVGNVLSWNAGAERMQGYRPEEIIGRHFSTFYTDEANQRRWPQQELEFASRDGRFEDEGWPEEELKRASAGGRFEDEGCPQGRLALLCQRHHLRRDRVRAGRRSAS